MEEANEISHFIIAQMLDKFKGDANSMMNALLNWEGILVALTMEIQANESRDRIKNKLENYVPSQDGDVINALLDLMNHELKRIEVAQTNYQIYEKSLSDMGINM